MKIFGHEMKSNLKALLFWSLGMVLLIATGVGKFTAMSGSAGKSASELMAAMPKSLQVIMGFNGIDVATVSGFYGVLFLYIILLASVHAASLGAGIISKEERDRTFEFLYVRPVTRTRIFIEKVLAALVNILILDVISFIVSVGAVAKVSSQNITNEILTMMVAMFITQLVFASIGLALSVLLKNSKAATGLSSLIVILAFMLSIFADLSEKLSFLRFFTPFKYFSAKNLLDNGLNGVYIVICAVVVAAAVIAAWISHKKRDLTV